MLLLPSAVEYVPNFIFFAFSASELGLLGGPEKPIVPILAVILATVLNLIAALHFYWALGGRWGSDAVIPIKEGNPASGQPDGQPTFSPGPFATAAVAILLFLAALVPLGTVGLVALPVSSVLIRFGVWALAVILLLRAVGDFRYVGLLKRVHGTRFASLDTRLYTPLCLMLSALAFGVAVGSA